MNYYPIDLHTFRVELILNQGNTWPQWTVNQPSVIVSTIENKNQKIVTVDLTVTSNQIVFSNTGKTGNETIVENGKIVRDQILTINRLWANNILLEKDQISTVSAFYPIYQQDNIDYAVNNNVILLEKLNQLDFYYNGNWVLEFERPFFIWYNNLLMNGLSGINHWFKKSHLGIGDQEQITQLTEILKTLND